MNIYDFNFSDTVKLVNAFSFSIFGRVLFDYSDFEKNTLPICIHFLLSEAISKFCFDADNAEINVKAREIISKIPELKRILRIDAESIFLHDPAAGSVSEVIMCYPGFYAIFCHRVAHEIYNSGFPILARFICEHAHSLTGIDIHPGAKIGEGFSIDHGTGIVIGETAVIGRNVKIYQGVTIGAKSFPKNSDGSFNRDVKRHPTVMDGCIIYACATILGADTVIGEGAVIGANVRVTSSVAPGTVIYYEKKG